MPDQSAKNYDGDEVHIDNEALGTDTGVTAGDGGSTTTPRRTRVRVLNLGDQDDSAQTSPSTDATLIAYTKGLLSLLATIDGVLDNIKTDTGNIDTQTDDVATETTLDAINTKLATIDAVLDTIKVDTEAIETAVEGTLSTDDADTQTLLTTIDAVLDAIAVSVAAIDTQTDDVATETTLDAINTKLTTIDAVLDAILVDTGQIDTQTDDVATQTTLAAIDSKLATIDTVLDNIKTDTGNIDSQTDDVATETTLAAIQTLLTTIDGVLDNIKTDTGNIDTQTDDVATETTLDAINTKLATIDAVLDTIKVDTEAIETAVEDTLNFRQEVGQVLYEGNQYSISDVAVAADSANDNTIIAAPGSGNRLVVLGYTIVAEGAVEAKWKSGATDKSGVMKFSIQGQGVVREGIRRVFACGQNEALILNLSAAVDVNGELTYITVTT